MKLTFMGTGASEGVPGIFCRCEDCKKARQLGGRELRSRSQLLINQDLLVDMGPETYLKSVMYGIELSRVKYLFITHSHCDHLDERLLGFRGGWFGRDMEEPVLFGYGSERAVGRMEKWLQDSPFDFVREACRLYVLHGFDQVRAGDYEVTALPAVHNPKEECLLYLIKDRQGREILYAADTGRLTEDTYEYLRGRHLKCVILDCTLGNKEEPGISHMGLRENKTVKDRLEDMGVTDGDTRYVCTHISHGTGGFEYLAEAAAGAGMEAAYDGMTITV